MCPFPCFCTPPRFHLPTVSPLELLGDKTPAKPRAISRIVMIPISFLYLLCPRALIRSDESVLGYRIL